MNENKRFSAVNLFTSMYFILFLYALSLFSKFSFSKMASNDFWWHVKTGEFIKLANSVPKTDPFSWYAFSNNLEWIAHEWLSDLVFYNIFDAFSYVGISVFILLSLAAIFLLSFFEYRKYFSENPITSSLFVVVFSSVLCAFSNYRPFMFSYMLFLLMLQSINAYLDGKSEGSVFMLPLLSILWVNLHGGSSGLIYMVPLFAIILSSFSIQFGRICNKRLSGPRLKKFILAYVLSLASANLNPYSYKMIVYPFANMKDTLMLTTITEWASPNFHNSLGIIILLSFASIVIPLILSRKKFSLYQLFLFSSFTYLSLKMVRMAPYFMLANYSLFFGHMPELKNKIKPSFIKSLMILFIVLNVFISIPQINSVVKDPVSREKFPYDSLEVIRLYKPKRMLNSYNYGGFYIYHLMDENIRVFIDGRADIYSKHTLKDYADMVSLDDTYMDTISKYGFDLAVFENKTKLLKLLEKEDNWIPVFRGETSTVLINTDYLEVEYE